MGLRLTDHSAVDSPFVVHREHVAKTKPTLSLKRVLDIIIASVAIVFFSPLILVCAVMIRMKDGGPALYSQKRYGLNGNTFKCYKLRSMATDAEAQLIKILATDPIARDEWERTQKLSRDPRITPIGHFMRKTSVDELPQLWNVIRGDMSVVGPRPIVQSEIARYAEHFERYSSVPPGITGLWQVRGRSNTTYEERVEIDVEYANTRSFWGDISIIFKTIPAVLRSRGAR